MRILARVAVACGLVGAGCGRSSADDRASRAGGSVEADSLGVPVRDVHTVRLSGARELVENSAAAMSRSQPAVLFSLNDSGNEPLLFAIDTTGADRGVWRVLDATNVDWESAAVASCGGAAPQGRDCVYIGDTGDNTATHRSRVIYRVPEPQARGGRDTVHAQALRFVYPDRPHDVEAMYVWSTGDIYLITKRPLVDSTGKLRPALVFALRAGAWNEPGRATARLVDSLPVVPGSAPFRLITDAALSPDRRHLVVRTYWQAYIFAIDGRTGMVDHSVAPSVCYLGPLAEVQGEGVTWADNRGRLVFTSEGVNAPLRIATCDVKG